MRFSNLMVLAALLSLSACPPPPRTPHHSYADDAKKAYDTANAEFDARNWIEAESLLRDLKTKYGYSRYAQLAELRIADADFEQGKYPEALRAYRQFVHDHPSDEKNIVYARARIVESQNAQIVDSIVMPSSVERDQAPVLDAYRELRSFLSDYAESEQAPRIRQLLREVTERLVRHELYVARFYLTREKFSATIERIQYAFKTYIDVPASDGVPVDRALEHEALLLLGETQMKMHRLSEAKASFQRIVDRGEGAPLAKQAANYIKFLKTRGA